MATLVITKTYADGDILTEADLDAIKDDVEAFLNVTGINDDNIQTAGITASSKLIDATISTAKIANSAITAGKLAADSVTTVKILDANVTPAKLSAAAKNNIVPVGSLLMWSTAAAPTDYLICDGTTVSETTYADLFAVVGTTFNTGGEGAGNFRLPAFNGRAPIGVGTYTDAVSGGITRVLGTQYGAAQHQLTISEMPSHGHDIRAGDGGIAQQIPPYGNAESFAGFDAGTQTYTTNSINGSPMIQVKGGSAVHNNMQPSLGIYFIIRYQ
jgi:microcystin-dependent protein